MCSIDFRWEIVKEKNVCCYFSIIFPRSRLCQYSLDTVHFVF